MIHGMTGFAERSFVSGGLRLKISIKTLNHRFFDWSFKGPPVGEAESRLRALSQKAIRRGRVEVVLDMISLSPESWNVTVNEGLLENILSSFDRISRRTGRPLEFSLDGLFRVPQLVELTRRGLTSGEIRFLERSFLRTLEEVVRRRRKEGRETALEIRGHLARIRRAVRRIDSRFREQPALIRAKLRKRLEDVGSGLPVSEERLAEESSILIQRYDMAEEISRIKTHLESLAALVSPRSKGPAGKQLDFLAQELFREANTLNSKSQDIRITKESLAVKNELESIRQHVQNIE